MGQKGGRAKGPRKARDAEHYRRIAQKRWDKYRAAKQTAKTK
jgi:hypothetical protein